MTENIFKDGGEFCMRGDPQQRPVEWHQFKSAFNARYDTVAYIDPTCGALRSCDSLGTYLNKSTEHAQDLIPIPKPTELVPWDCPDDVPEPCWIKEKGQTNVFRIIGLGDGGAYFDSAYYTWKNLFNDFEWHTDRKAKDGWKSCGKIKI